MKRKPRIVVAGQVPPPVGGQSIMIARLLDALSRTDSIRADHLEFKFTRDFTQMRTAGASKLVEAVKVIGRLLRLRCSGPIDLIIYPTGGPQNVPLIRDLLLLPWVLLLCRGVVLHFHAGGIAERLASGSFLPRLVARLYGRCHAAIIMTEFNRRDPETCGVADIRLIPHRLDDEFDPAFVDRSGQNIIVLYMGNLCHDKGTPALIEAFASISKDFPNATLELAGEYFPPYNANQLRADIRRTGVADRVRLLGVLQGREKQRAFGRSHLFVFPSVAPSESFGLVMVEAMMWGLPVVASDWRGNADVAGDAGTYYDPEKQPANLAVALRSLLADKNRRNELSRKSREAFETRFLRTSNEYFVAEIISLIDRTSSFDRR